MEIQLDGKTPEETVSFLQSMVKVKPRTCCSEEKGVIGNPGFSKGKHQHKSSVGASDHATGFGFEPDKSTTKAVLKRMKALGIKWEGNS